jgi:prephenate dehydrogenase
MLQAEALSEDELALAGSGFRDFTRIAGSNPELWAGILLDNRAAVIELLQQQRLGIARMEELLDKQQREPLVKALSVARERRAGLA